MSLAARLLLLVGLATLPALSVIAYNEYALRRERAADLRTHAQATTNRAAAEVRQMVEEVQRLSAVLSKLPEVVVAASSSNFSPACSDLLVSLRHEYPGQLQFGVANKDGVVVCTTRGGSATIPSRTRHFARAMEANAFVVGAYGEGPTTSTRYLTFAYPIRGAAGPPVGAVLTGLELGWLAERLRPFATPDSAVLSVHDRDLVFLARVPDDAGLIGKKPPPQVQALSSFANKGAIEATGADGTKRVGAIVSIPISPDALAPPDLSVAFGLSRDAAFAEIDAATYRNMALLALSVALAALAAWYGGRRFIRAPIERLLAAASRWRVGDYSARVDLRDRNSELGRLSTAFEEMAEALGRRESDQRMLIDELNHRVKNTLTTVQSVASQSFRDAVDAEQAKQDFEARLLALSRTHDVLTRERWESASILDVVSGVIEPYAHGAEGARFRIEGPALRLPPGIVLPLSMALHELCTNAVKHGALSTRAGQVAITWEVHPAGNARQLQLRWVESGGPAVQEPSRRGFGTRLIERGLSQQLGGSVRLRFALRGVVCEMDVPLPEPGTPARIDFGRSRQLTL